MNIKEVILILFSIILISNIQVRIIKRNLFIPQNSSFQSTIQLQRQNAQLIPTTLSLQTSITNSIPNFGDYFDYFYFLTPPDLQCYQNAVQNQSFLFPCSFLTNHYSKNRVSEVDSEKFTQEIEDIIDVKFSFIIDNTLFPYPTGAYSYSNINVDISTTLTIDVSSSYEVLGVRLIFINVTIFLIFLVIIVTIIWKTNAIAKKMKISKNDSSTDDKRTPFLQEREEDYESSFISQEGEEVIRQEQMMREKQSPQVMLEEQNIIMPERLRNSNESAAKVKSGLIQYLSSRAEDL